MLLLSPGSGTAAADKQIEQLGLTGAVDKVVIVKSATSTSRPWALIVVSVVLAAFGVLLLGLAARRSSRATPEERPTSPVNPRSGQAQR